MAVKTQEKRKMTIKEGGRRGGEKVARERAYHSTGK